MLSCRTQKSASAVSSVRGSGAAVEPLRDLLAVRVEQHAADAGVGPEGYAGRRGQLERTLHGLVLGCGEGHLLLLRLNGAVFSALICGTGLRHSARGRRGGGKTRAGPRGCVAPTMRGSSHPDFDRRSRSSTWSTGHWL